jgi:LysM repeat protein
MKFLADIAAASPNTAIILTTAPDTRSRNRIPPAQKSVNQQLQKIAAAQKLTLYDLNKAMGGWGSLHIWYNHKLTLTDKLHFNAAGYALQGQLFTLSLLQAYNKANPKDTLNISALKNTVHTAMSTLVRDFSAVSLGDSMATDSINKINGPNKSNPVTNNTNGTAPAGTTDSLRQNPRNNTISPPRNNPPQRSNQPQRSNPANNRSPRMSQGEVTHTVRSGENLYRIAQRYHVTHEAIAKRNNLSNPRALRIGQRLIIPAR